MRLLNIFLGIALLSASSSAEAASFSHSYDKTGNPVVNLSGEILPGDDLKFASAIGGDDHLTISLNSFGGDTLAALAIGRQIRSKKYSTVVPSGAICGSACALIWLAGERRILSGTARVGFHGAFRKQGSAYVVSPEGDALIGAYLNWLGYGVAAIVYFTESPQDKAHWLSPDAAKRIGFVYEQEPQAENTSTLNIMVKPERRPRLMTDWMPPGKGVEIPYEAYITYSNRTFFACQSSCQNDPMCKAINYGKDGSCSLLDGSSFGHPNEYMTSWERKN
jgi:hypothetical protein